MTGAVLHLPEETSDSILAVRDLRVSFQTARGWAEAIHGVSFELRAGETLAIVGESGSGKSVTALSILRLLKAPPARIDAGSVAFSGMDLLRVGDRELRRIRGNRISMIFQEPMTSLTPVMTVGRQIGEPLERHHGMSRGQARERAIELLNLVRVPDAEQRIDQYPHQLSGGMRQRIMIAIALACNPAVLIADEPTTALDVTIQAQVLTLIGDLKRQMNTAVILITHDLGVVAEAAERVIVMYAGVAVEEAPVRQLFETPSHPYTIGLLESRPSVGTAAAADHILREIPGSVPGIGQHPAGCVFAPRCFRATPVCTTTEPPVIQIGVGHTARCWHAETANHDR